MNDPDYVSISPSSLIQKLYGVICIAVAGALLIAYDIPFHIALVTMSLAGVGSHLLKGTFAQINKTRKHKE